jgi:hypothetical protein
MVSLPYNFQRMVDLNFCQWPQELTGIHNKHVGLSSRTTYSSHSFTNREMGFSKGDYSCRHEPTQEP